MKARAMLRGGLAGIAVVAALATSAQQPSPVSHDPAQLSQPQYPVRMQHNVKVRMRDGVELSADLYLPDAPGGFLDGREIFGRERDGDLLHCK